MATLRDKDWGRISSQMPWVNHNTNLQTTAVPCGSELARDGFITVNIDVECQSAIASKLAPTQGIGAVSSF
jgi:hypothetical protein